MTGSPSFLSVDFHGACLRSCLPHFYRTGSFALVLVDLQRHLRFLLRRSKFPVSLVFLLARRFEPSGDAFLVELSFLKLFSIEYLVCSETFFFQAIHSH